MYIQFWLVNKCFVTHTTAIWTFPSMYMLMYHQRGFANECFIAHITAIWTLPSMYTLMYLQRAFANECFITHITTMGTLPSMYNLLSFHSALLHKYSTRNSLSKKEKIWNYITVFKRCGKQNESDIWGTVTITTSQDLCSLSTIKQHKCSVLWPVNSTWIKCHICCQNPWLKYC